MTLKEQLHGLIDTLSDDDTAVEQLQYQLYVLSKVRRGLVQIDAGLGVSHEQALEKMDRWLSK